MRTILLIVLMAGLLLGAVLTWGSLGSGVLVFCLIMAGAGIVYQHFLTNRDEDDMKDE